MRIWSLHPSLLDAKGIVALWRETLLAKHVIGGDTKGYRHHPQLKRFKSSQDPHATIHLYLKSIYEESVRRGYTFDISKFDVTHVGISLPVTEGQLAYEYQHLMKKLQIRDPLKHAENLKLSVPMAHPLFYVIPGDIEDWEIVR